MSMDKKRGVDNDLDYPIVQRVSSIDSLEQTDLISSISDSLQCISGHHQWFNSHERILVEKTIDQNHAPFFSEQVHTLVPRHDFKIPQDDEDYDDDDDEYSIQHRTYSLPTTLLFYKKNLLENEEDFNDDDDDDDDDDESSFNQMDLSLTPFDIQLQVTDSPTDSTTLYDRFSSIPLEFQRRENTDQSFNYHQYQTSDSEMDDDDQPHSESKRNNPKNSNSYSSQNNDRDRNDGSSRRNRQTNDSTGNNNDSGSNPNRNNNNSRKSNNDGDDDDDDQGDKNNFNHSADDEQDDDETDENLARRLGFVPLKDETIRIIGRLRHLTRKKLFDRRDFETLQFLIDELIQNRHMESFTHDQLKQMIKGLKLDRPFHSTTRALTFLQERIPRRAVKYQVISSTSPTNENVFNIWRERERRARLDSKDSLEDDAPTSNGQKLRDVAEINHPTPPIVVSNMTLSLNKNNTSKVRQMAKDIDTKSTSLRNEINVRTATDRVNEQVDYHPNTSSPPNSSNSVSVAFYSVKSPNQDTGFHSETQSDERETLPTISNSSTPNQSEQNRVRKMIHRLESSMSSPSKPNSSRPAWSKKSFHEEISDGSNNVGLSSPPKRLARRDLNDLQTHNQISQNEPFLFKRDQIATRPHQSPSGSTTDEYVTYTRPELETSVSMVREVRTRLCDDESSKTNRDDKEMVEIKVDVETLYILEQKSEKPSMHSSMVNVFVPEPELQSSPIKDQHDFGVQTISPPSPAKPVHRPIGIQVNSTVPQQNCSVQTTDSLHRPPKERQRLPSSCLNNDQNVRTPRSQSVEKKYEVKRRYSSRRCSDDEDDEEGAAVIFIDDKPKEHSKRQNNHFELNRDRSSSVSSETALRVPEQQPTFGRITSRIHIDKLCDLNRHVVHRHVQDNQNHDEEHRSNEVYEIHSRGTFKCLVISSEESSQYGRQTRVEQQMERIEQSYTDDDLKKTELHVIVTSSNPKYRVVKRDYGRPASLENLTPSKQPSLTIHYYNAQGRHMCTESSRALALLPLFIRCEIEYELNHYGSARLIVLSVTNAERRQTNIALKENIVYEILSRSNGRLSMDSPELEEELRRRLAESTHIIHLTDYTSRDEHQQVNSTDLRRVSRIDVTTSLQLVQHYRTLIHHLSRLYRSNLRLTSQSEQQRQLILVARDEYYLLDLKEPVQSTITDIRQRQHDIFKREVNNALQEPFDYAKYRSENQQQQEKLLAEHVQKRQGNQNTPTDPPPCGHPSEAEFYLGSQRRALIEREIHAMRHSIRSHEHTPPQSKNEPLRRSLSICYSGGQRFTRARIIHVKDFYEDATREESNSAKEQELFIRVDDHINQRVANSLRRSFSTDYLYDDGPRSRVHYIRIPCEAIRSEQNACKKPQGVMYANLPYSLRYWNILYILDREARQGRPLGSSLPKLIVNDPYQTLIPPLTQHEIRQTAQQILSPGYDVRSYTDQTLRWFLSRDNRTEIESAKYLQTLNHYRHQNQAKPSFENDRIESKFDKTNTFFSKKTIDPCAKRSDRLVPVPMDDRNSNKISYSSRSPSTPRPMQAPGFQQNFCARSQSYPRPTSSSSTCVPQSLAQTSHPHPPFSSTQLPISRHQSVHELHANNGLSHPPSPSPSLHSLHNYQSLQQQQQHRRPVAFHNRYTHQKQAPLFTEIIDSQTGRRILTTSQEQLPTEVLGLLNKYNLQKI